MKTAVINQKNSSEIPFQKVIDSFFSNNSPERAKFLFWKLFQCYILKDCNTKIEVPEKEVALFYDQLMDLVAAAYILHQADRASNKSQEGTNHV